MPARNIQMDLERFCAYSRPPKNTTLEFTPLGNQSDKCPVAFVFRRKLFQNNKNVNESCLIDKLAFPMSTFFSNSTSRKTRAIGGHVVPAIRVRFTTRLWANALKLLNTTRYEESFQIRVIRKQWLEKTGMAFSLALRWY